MNQELKQKLFYLAEKYETADFILNDPSQFMHNYKSVCDIETSAFISANLAFGRRDQILKHIKIILDKAGASPSQWILSKKYLDFFPDDNNSFYRMYSNKSMILFFNVLYKILIEHDTPGNYFKKIYEEELKTKEEKIYPAVLIASCFPQECNLIPHTKTSAAKKLNLFLRWMVRDNSPVDLGLWKWYSKKDLLMPLDIHVMSQATELNLFNKTSSGKILNADLKKAIALTEQLKEVFPDDPVKGDFALFGLGVNKD